MLTEHRPPGQHEGTAAVWPREHPCPRPWQEVSLQDVRKEINFCHKVKLPIIGVVENMSGFICPKCKVRAGGPAPAPSFLDMQSQFTPSIAD